MHRPRLRFLERSTRKPMWSAQSHPRSGQPRAGGGGRVACGFQHVVDVACNMGHAGSSPGAMIGASGRNGTALAYDFGAMKGRAVAVSFGGWQVVRGAGKACKAARVPHMQAMARTRMKGGNCHEYPCCHAG